MYIFNIHKTTLRIKKKQKKLPNAWKQCVLIMLSTIPRENDAENGYQQLISFQNFTAFCQV